MFLFILILSKTASVNSICILIVQQGAVLFVIMQICCSRHACFVVLMPCLHKNHLWKRYHVSHDDQRKVKRLSDDVALVESVVVSMSGCLYSNMCMACATDYIQNGEKKNVGLD